MDRLRDELSTALPSAPTELNYPFPPPDCATQLTEVAPGVRWLRLPMPYSLDHVNVYLLQTAEGWLVVDTGLSCPKTREIWEEVFSGALRGEKVVGICCTHYHGDHVGSAGYLADRWRVPLYMSYGEYFTGRGWPAAQKEVPWQHAELLRRAGYPEELFEKSLALFDFGGVAEMPLSFSRLREGSTLPPLGGEWQVLVGEGHAPEHVMLLAAEKKMLISGDQLLPRISTNVSVTLVDPDDEPLSRWLASLDRLAELPEDILVLPGHGLPFYGSRIRVDELRAHHERRFGIIESACTGSEPTGYQLMQLVYPYPLNDFDRQLAFGECLSHLRYLLARGRLSARLDDSGVLRYRSLQP
jgi:glyoxylase-like metal-dependent hydrolase (beta-lactamase superfamily II)